jgi:hypothetical protein
MRSEEYKNLVEAYQKVYEQQIGVPLNSPTDSAAAKKLGEIIQKQGLGKPTDVVIPKSGLQKAHYEPDGEVLEEGENFYDFVLSRLIEEGNTREESLEMMVNIDEGRLEMLKQAAQMWRMMANPKSVPIKPPGGPTNLTNIFKGSTPPPVKPPAKFQIGTPPKPSSPVPTASTLSRLAPTALRAGTIAGLTQLQGDTPQSGPVYDAQQKARAQAMSKYAAKTGQFGKYGEPTSRFANARDTAFAKAKQIKGSPVVGPKNVGSGTPSAPKPVAKPVVKPQPPTLQSKNVTPGGVSYERRAATRAELDAARKARFSGQGEEGAIKAAVEVKKSNK